MRIVASVTPNKTKFGPLLFPGNLELACEYLQEAEYDGIELSLLDSTSPVEIGRVEELLRRTSLSLVSIATGQSYLEDGFSLFTGDEVLRAKCVGRLKNHIDYARQFGSAVIVGGIRGKIDRIEFIDEYRTLGERSLVEVCAYAEAKGVTILLEPVNRYETNVLNTVQDAYELIKRHGLEDMARILPDTFHMNIEEVDMVSTVETYADSIGALHCADSNRLAIGMGHTDLAPVIAKLNADRLLYLGVEVLPLPTSEEAATVAMKTIRDALRSM
jgi:sugar phosphate isomerase/epimerase